MKRLSILKRKWKKRESAPIGPVDQKEEAKESKVQPKPMNIPPTRKVAYRADDLKVGDKLIVYLPTKKGSYLGEVRKIWLPVEEAPEDTEKWIRVHLWGRVARGSSTFAPWWIDGRKQCFLKRASHHGPLIVGGRVLLLGKV